MQNAGDDIEKQMRHVVRLDRTSIQNWLGHFHRSRASGVHRRCFEVQRTRHVPNGKVLATKVRKAWRSLVNARCHYLIEEYGLGYRDVPNLVTSRLVEVHLHRHGPPNRGSL